MLSRIPFLLFFIATIYCHSQTQRIDEFGKPSRQELDLKKYEAEPEASGVILYESGNYYAASSTTYNAVRLVKEIHRKIKVLNAKTFDYATVEIPFHDGNRWSGEEVLDYKAVTHNGSIKTFVPESAFYTTQNSKVEKALKFTFPNIKDGSILEYRYSIVSPYFYDLSGWEFQHELPTVYSYFQTALPDNFKYNQILYGNKKLDISTFFVKEKGFLLPTNSEHINLEVRKYAMHNISSFTEEDYMLAKKNYISRVVYEPLEFKSFYGNREVRIFTRNWKDVDERFKNDEDFGEQLTMKNYFRRKLPTELLKIEGNLERAKAVYDFIQKNYTWNGRYFNYETKVKDNFDDKLGSVAAINLSLINALNAVGLNAKAVILSTRNNGLPTEIYPVLSNFNYVLAVLMINNERILLDATNKQSPFGIIPFPALNVQGRVMDFKKGSYWMPIEPFKQNIHFVNAQITADGNGDFSGKVSHVNYGYIGLGKRNTIDEETVSEYIKTAQKDKAGIEIENYQVEDIHEIEKPLTESYDVTITPETVGDKVILFPFFNKTYISENPFKMNERSYPMDFGFPFTNTYVISIDLGSMYGLEQLPKSRSIKLPNDDGECSVTYVSEGSKINIRFNMKLNQYRFPPDAYPSLKEFFGTMVTMLKDESIVLKKI